MDGHQVFRTPAFSYLAPVMRDIIEYLTLTRQMSGSDLHLAVGVPPATRVNGVLQPLEEAELSPETCRELVYSVLSQSQRARLEADFDLDFALTVRDVGRFRGNAHFCRGNVEAAFRFVPHEVPDLASLGHGSTVEQICDSRAGLVLITGMAGMGKTTTMAAMAKRILAARSGVMVTIEDPIEFVLQHSYALVKQRQIGDDAKSFSAALRSALRQDPDTIIVGEMRDLETIQLALTAAETGHLVISTLHAIDAPKALDRLVDVFPADQQAQIRAQLANALVAILSQRLLSRADAPGRVLASEILRVNDAVRTVIREGRVERLVGLLQIGAHEGMHTIDDSLAHLAVNGHVALDDALAHARDPEFIKQAWARQQAKLAKR